MTPGQYVKLLVVVMVAVAMKMRGLARSLAAEAPDLRLRASR